MADDKVKIDIRRVRKEPTIYEKNSLYLISDIGDEDFVLIVTDPEGNPKNISIDSLKEWVENNYALRTRSITGKGSLEGGGDLTQDRTIDLKDETKTDIGLGVEANSWGDHKTEGYLKDNDLDGFATEDWVEGKGYITSYEDTTYTAGEGLDLDEGEFSITQSALDALEEAHTHPNKDIIDDIASENISNWDSAFQDSHTHTNKSVLDGIDSDDIDNWGEAYNNSHTHLNKSTLDGIQDSDISNWDEAYAKAHEHANKTLLDSLEQGDLNNWNEAYNKAHTHANKTILDGISSSDIEDWEEAYNKKVNAISFTGDTNKTLTVTREDGTTITASFLDNNAPQFPDDVLNTLTFNTNNDGVLRAITSLGEVIDVSLDGRYSLLGHKHVWADITDRPTELSQFTNNLGNYGNWITKALGDTYYAPLAHVGSGGNAHALATTSVAGFMSGADKTKLNSLSNYIHPSKTWVDKSNLTGATVISNLTINSLGHPTNWVTRTLTAANIGAATSNHTHATLTQGTGITAFSYNGSTARTVGILPAVMSDIALGKTAHGWGNHSSAGYLKTVPDSFVTKNNINSSALANTVIDFDAPGNGASILYAGASSTNVPSVSGTAGGLLMRGNHSTLGEYQLYLARGENDALLYRNQSGVWNRAASREWTDGHFALRTRTITGTGSLTGGGDLTANRTIDLTATAKSDIAKGVTAHGWGDFRDFGLGGSALLRDFNDQDVNSINYIGQSTSNNPFDYGGVIRFGSSSSYIQLYGEYVNGQSLHFRKNRNGVFYKWRELWHSGNLANGTTSQYIRGDGSLATYANTTYTTGTLAQLNAKTDNVGRLQTAKLLNDWLNAQANATGTVSGSLVRRDGLKVNSSGGFFETSDIRLKTNIAPLESITDKVIKIPTVTFDMFNIHTIGTIAQDVQELFPELVEKNDEDVLTVNYSKLGVLAIASIKEQNTIINDLTRRLERLEKLLLKDE